MFKPLKKILKSIIIKLIGFDGFLILKNFMLSISISRLIYRSRVEKKIYLFLHVARSGGTYLKNILNITFGNTFEDSEFQSKEIEKFLNKPTVLFAFQRKHTEYNEKIEKHIYRIMFIRNPKDRLISRFFYLLNFNKIKNTKSENIISKSDMNFSQYLDLILENYDDNLVIRSILNKKNHTNYENQIVSDNKNIKFKLLDEQDYKNSLNILKKYEIIPTENIDDFIKDKFKINHKKIKKKFSQNYKNVSLKNDIEFSNTDIEKLNKVTYYDNKLYNYFKNS